MAITSLEQLAKELQKRINNALKTTVAPIITQEMSNTIKEVTYMEYTPTEYERTGELANVKNMQIEMIDDNTISITNERMDGSIDVARIVATGIGYSWKNSEIYQHPFARDFYADTIDRLRANQAHIIAMREGLKAQGLTVL